MTKTKSKKMTKSTFAIIIMAVVMVAMLAFGGTYAYFTATASEVKNTVTTGTVKLNANTMATLVSDKVVSGSSLIDTGSVQVTSASNVDTYVFVTFSVTFDGAGNPKKSAAECTTEGDYFLDVTQAAGWTPVSDETNVYGRLVTAAEANTPIDVCTGIRFYGYSQSTESTTGTLMNKTITITISSEAIQAIDEDGNGETNYASVDAAWNALHPGT